MARSTAAPAADRSMPTRSAEALLWTIAARMSSALPFVAPLPAAATGAPPIVRAALAPSATSQRVESFKRVTPSGAPEHDAAGGRRLRAGPARPRVSRSPRTRFLGPSARRYCTALVGLDKRNGEISDKVTDHPRGTP